MITVVVLARNEAHLLRSLLPTLSFADSIRVMDDDSDDDTEQVCAQFGAVYVKRSLNGDFSAQRNAALKLIKKGWVFFIDADERLSQELQEALMQVTTTKTACVGYHIRRIDQFLGKQLQYGETGQTWLLRLAKVEAGLFSGKVHERWQIQGECGRLGGYLLHNSHESIGQLFAVISWYASLRAKELIELGKPLSVLQALFYPLGKFIYTYGLKLGFLDGWRGLVMSLAMSWHSWLVRWNLWDRPWEKTRSPHHWLKYIMVVPVLLLPFGQLGRFWLGESVSLYGFELVMIAAIIAYVLSHQARDCFAHKPVWFWPLFVFSIWLSLSWLWWWGQAGWVEAGFYVVRWWIYAVYGFFFWRWSQKGFISIAGLLNFVGLAWLVGGIIQYLWFPDLRFLKWYGWDDHYFRMTGLLFDPNFFGLLLVLFGLWIVFKHNRWVRIVGGGVVMTAVLATYSRASYVVGLMVGLVVLWSLVKRYRWMVLAGMGCIIMAWWLVAPRVGGEGVNLLRTYSVESRLHSWKTAGLVWQESPLIGIGYNRYRVYMEQARLVESIPYHPSAPDNSFLFVLVTSGIVGMVIWLWLLLVWWQTVNFGGRLSLAAILIHSLFNNSFFLPFVLMWWWLLLAEQGLSNRTKRLS